MAVTVNQDTGEITGDEEPEAPTLEPDDDDEAADDEERHEAPDDEEPPHAGPVSDEEHAQVFDKAIKRAKTYMAAVPTILGDSATDLGLCPRCTDLLPGFILPLHIKPVPDEQKYAVKASIGEVGEMPLKQADDAFVCGKCDGYGKVLTGSKIPTKREATCLECNGDGWTGVRKQRLAALPPEERAALHAVATTPAEEQPPQDPWGRFQDDPLYGVMPGFERS